MAVFRMSIFFRSVDDEGWSENYYWDGSNITSARTAMDTLVSQRLDLLNGNVEIVDARVSDVTVRGSVLFSTLSFPLVGTYSPAVPSVPLEANVAYAVQFLSVAPYFSRVFLRGLSSSFIVGREKVAETGWDALFAIWLATVQASSYQSRHRVTPPPHATYNYHSHSGVGNFVVCARKPGRPFGLLVGRR